MNLDYFTLTRRLVLAASLAASLGGCMSSTPVWDSRFGDSVRAVMQAQIIDPHAAEHAPSTPGVDGSAAAAALDNYDKSFQQIEPTPNAFVIGVGGGKSGGQ
ncbi:hypothetical protein [Burkholderia thailandensis]|uniref:tRNA delta(2)-isopentenylpyrophosphate transferase n=2 Tax=Burkholderia thailandensis TaxID=57975 RepID=A0AAW9CRF8_BURTH|nr:hypothetical protein [Burkholderia thailandensis]ABC36273.1 conserved hypothetical protein [Burkholderia thailandensis E264]AHI68021.1 putative transmembrane lipoprotein [Burkholderia thailandensis H0587]AHI76973.1 putative transmembrane lipoprotein [Burkholderia thailandensis 2002721723]AHI82351.1 putative transmembrane lipoprotein [Burkholderia thailandensis E444]AIP26358.1 putative transmembrane lipoprotein [Burkholderia thailandensis E264]